MDRHLEEFRSEVISCSKCELAKTRNNVVFGEGNKHAPIFIISEAPGREEDLCGRPFVGASGQLLDKIFSACNFSRTEHIYISNVVKCRPPNNRPPNPEEICKCKPSLLEQINIVDPAILVLLGATALRNMTGPDMKITKMRGEWFHCENRLAMAVYHPSALLRNPALKKDTWADFKRIILKYREIVDPSHYCRYI